MAQIMRPFLEPVPHRDPPVKDETFALPRALLLRHLFEVFQNPALEVIDLFNPLLEQVIRALLAADTAGAKHRHALVVKALFIRLPPLRELAKAFGLRVDRALECADRHLVIIARVDHRHIVRTDQIVPFGRLDIMADAGARIDIGLAHGDDLGLQAHLHAAKGLLGGKAFLMHQIAASRQSADMRQNRVNSGARSGDGAVDPLMGDEQGAGDPFGGAKRLERGLHGLAVGETGEVIERCDGIGHGAPLARPRPAAQEANPMRAPINKGICHAAFRPAARARPAPARSAPPPAHKKGPAGGHPAGLSKRK